MKNNILYAILIGIFFAFNINCMKKPKEIEVKLNILSDEAHAIIFKDFSIKNIREMKTVNKDFLYVLRKIDIHVENAFKNYFAYPHLSGMFDQLSTDKPDLYKEIINDPIRFSDFLSTNQKLNQSKDCKEILEQILKHDLYKKICNKHILNAAVPYFNSINLMHFFKIKQSDYVCDSSIIQTFSCDSKDNRDCIIDMTYIVGGDFSNQAKINKCIKKIFKHIEKQQDHKKIRLIFKSKNLHNNEDSLINKSDLHNLLYTLSQHAKNNTAVSNKIIRVDLTYLLPQVIDLGNIDKEFVEIIEDNKIEHVITYMPKTTYLTNILRLSRQETSGIIPRPDYFNQVIEMDLFENLTDEQLKILFDNNCGLDLLYFLTVQSKESYVADQIINLNGELFSTYLTPYIKTMNHHSVLSALIMACVNIFGTGETENLSITTIKKLIEHYTISTFEKMMRNVIVNMNERTLEDLKLFLNETKILEHFTANKK